MIIHSIPLTNRDKNRGLRLPNTLDEKLAEDIGIHIGDGCINRNNTGFDISYSMNAIEDLEYSRFVIKLKKYLFGIDFKVRIVKENEVRFNTYSKTLARFYNEIFGLPLGRKTNIIINLCIGYTTLHKSL